MMLAAHRGARNALHAQGLLHPKAPVHALDFSFPFVLTLRIAERLIILSIKARSSQPFLASTTCLKGRTMRSSKTGGRRERCAHMDYSKDNPPSNGRPSAPLQRPNH